MRQAAGGGGGQVNHNKHVLLVSIIILQLLAAPCSPQSAPASQRRAGLLPKQLRRQRRHPSEWRSALAAGDPWPPPACCNGTGGAMGTGLQHLKARIGGEGRRYFQ